MVGRKAVVVAVPVIALLLGLGTAGLSWLAYAKRIKAEDVRIGGQGKCIYPSSAAFAIGILAALLVLIQQILISAATSCFCCCRTKFPRNWCGVLSLILFLLSWASSAVTFIGLIVAALINNSSFMANIHDGFIPHKKDECMGSETMFLGIPVWCAINVIFVLATYATFRCGLRKHKAHKDRDAPLFNLPA
ncbi:hypothetical protein vseg_001049 [Gypsophila vaccaria]